MQEIWFTYYKLFQYTGNENLNRQPFMWQMLWPTRERFCLAICLALPGSDEWWKNYGSIWRNRLIAHHLVRQNLAMWKLITALLKSRSSQVPDANRVLTDGHGYRR
jgi:hypothetical protein